MATVVTGAYTDKSAVALWNEDEKLIRAKYDFSVDAGAFADVYNLVKLPVGYMIVDADLHVKTAITSSGSATIEVGVTGSTAVIVAQTAKGNAGEDIVLALVGKQIVDSTNNTVILTIGTADLLTGVFDLVIKLRKAN